MLFIWKYFSIESELEKSHLQPLKYLISTGRQIGCKAKRWMFLRLVPKWNKWTFTECDDESLRWLQVQLVFNYPNWNFETFSKKKSLKSAHLDL